MLNLDNHPDAEALSAFAAGDTGPADASIVDHIGVCATCSTLVSELTALRAVLAELPDLAPPRPLRLIGEVAPPARAFTGWARRLFGPILAGGAALAMAGMIGTAAPALGDLAGQAAGDHRPVGASDQFAAASQRAEMGPGAAVTNSSGEDRESESSNPPGGGVTGEQPSAQTDQERSAAVAERSPWPMVLFTGVALMIGAAMLRWILAPRAP